MEWTRRAALRRGEERLAAAGVEAPRAEAEILLAHVLVARRLDLYAYPERSLSPSERDCWEALLARRETREPLPYITGRVEFYGLPFRVGPGVLIPRPETEVLVEAVLEDPAVGVERPRILDVGAGSGCIGLSLASRLPDALVIALEPSPAALAMARENAAALRLAERVEWVEGAWPYPGRYDAVVANPPYIPSDALERLAPEVKEHEPRLALDGGPDGLSLVRRLIAEAPAYLGSGGLLAMEMAAGQSEAVLREVRAVGAWEHSEIRKDLADIPRVLLARRR